jgi:3-hydroxyacyl-CoA dehydrogenase
MVSKVAVVGTGVIGASWVTHFLVRGLDVVATDPAPGAERRLRALVAEQWETARSLGSVEGASMDRLVFEDNVQRAVEGAEFVQENGPERLEVKRALFKLLDEAAGPDVPLASSSSGIQASQFQTACLQSERVLIGHPFNPSHLIPLVEVVGGELTAPLIIEAAMAFYRSVGKQPIHVRKEVAGHITNRLQAALWREAYGLVEHGVASVSDIDLAISNGPGLRWALLGPFVNQQLSGGEGGMAHLLEHLGPPMDDWWQDLYQTRLTDKVKAAVIEGAAEETADWDMSRLAQSRDELLVQLMRLKAADPQIP